MKLLVAGGRDYWMTDIGFNCLNEVIDIYKVDCVIQGGAKGIDTAAKQWANYRKIDCITVKAEWDLYGKRAGYLRNKKMMDMLTRDEPVLIYPGGRGSNMMREIALEYSDHLLDVMDRQSFVRNVKYGEIFLVCNLCNNPMCGGTDCLGELYE